jgi:hypothetical protein
MEELFAVWPGLKELLGLHKHFLLLPGSFYLQVLFPVRS